jgi:hypothetical protein
MLGGILGGVACKPNLDQTVSSVTGTRVLAVQSSPPEAPPMGQVTFTALVVDANGPVAHPDSQWDFCDIRNPLANLGPVAPACAVPGTTGMVPFGGGSSATGTVPQDACSQFGPNPPAPMAGQPPGRPVDPDSTGGYYAPVSYFVEDPPSPVISIIYPTRLVCGFAGVDPTSLGQLTTRYHSNTNPVVDSLAIVSGEGGASPDGGGSRTPVLPDPAAQPNVVSSGESLTLEVAWPDCPLVDQCSDTVCGPDETTMSCPVDCKAVANGIPAPGNCNGAERYVNFDLSTQSVVDAREGIHVAWYATDGSFDNDRTGREATDDATTSDNGWQAPSSPGTVHLWVVLADDRGGVGWQSYTLNVQ